MAKYYGRVKAFTGRRSRPRAFSRLKISCWPSSIFKLPQTCPLRGKDTEMEWARQNTRYAIVCAAGLFIGLGLAVARQGQTQAAASKVTVPAGTRILIRMVDSVDSSKQQVGYRFTANLETNLQVGDVVVAPRGTYRIWPTCER